ncbi:MAG: TRAP transporter substrate-binding protein [Syntrophobacteraceae bacterium]
MSKVLFFLVALSAASYSVEVPALTLRSADIHVESYPTVQAVKYMGQLLSERSGGRLSIEVLHSGQLGEEKELLEQCRAGGLDMMRTNIAPLVDDVSEAAVVAMPYIFRSEDHLHNVLDGPIGEEILNAMEKTGLVGLAFYDSGARSFYNSRRPLRTLEDFKGLRIRTQQTELFKAMVEALGGVAVPMAFGEVRDALRNGVIDGAENNLPSYHFTGHYTVAKYYTLDRHSMPPEILVFSRKVWAGISEDDKKLIIECARDSVPHMRELWRARETQSLRGVEESGAQVIGDIDKTPFIEAVKPLYDRYLSTDKLLDMARRIRETP